MGNVANEEIALAAAKADKSDEAAKLIQQAGGRLMEVFNSARANAVTLGTLAQLQVAQGCITEAAVLLLEAVAVTHNPAPKPKALEIPGGARLEP